MGDRGKVQQPTALIKKKGYYKKTKHEDAIADSSALSFVYRNVPTPPDHFDEIAVQIWNSTLMEASNLYGYISFIDLALFSEYCECYSELQHLNNQCRGNAVIYKDDNGVRRTNPLFKERDDKRKMLIQISREFGFTPSARSRLALVQKVKEEKEDDYENVL
jgi:P27 family predicted phage terminase small subunit